MSKASYETQIHDRLQGKQHLQPIFTSALGIPERLREMDPNYFLVLNTKTQKYEVHNLAHKGNTYGITIYYDELDYRTLYITRASDLRYRKNLLREIDEHNEKIERIAEKDRRNELRGVGEEMKPYFSRLAWEGI
ncbi:hypothetical protein [Phosphitispora fastidiosa]|uniref:hypothetical protein n=1 Tax=Phosphitispora fastidiosa TaxID=2837202 RepID=UPI001E49D49E|nr:hypothetical protein [Phosphitispora fastidiosa]MBU7006301.1 hypothetical protein [Phosphitispora fastidiosa]